MARQDSTAATPSRERFQRIYRLVEEIPAGQVASYGQVALVTETPSARIVGNAMAALPDGTGVPWHRVLNSQGKISDRKEGGSGLEQQRRLKAEGVFLDKLGRVDFAAVAWPGPSWQWLEDAGVDIDSLILRSQGLRRSGCWVNWRF